MKFVFNFVFICLFSLQFLGQDKTELAQIYFIRAQNSFNQKNIENTIKYLDKAKSNFGGITKENFAVFGANFFFDINNQQKAQEYIKAFFNLKVNETSPTYSRMLLLFTYNSDVLDDSSKFESIKKRVANDKKNELEKYYLLAKSSFEVKDYLQTEKAIEEYLLLYPEITSKQYKEIDNLSNSLEAKIILKEKELVAKANAAYNSGKYEKTISIIEQYLKTQPDESSVTYSEMSALMNKSLDAFSAVKANVDSLSLENKVEVNLDSISNAAKIDSINSVNKKEELAIYKDEIISFLLIDEAPVLPSCEENNSYTKSCFSKNIASFFDTNFDKKILNNLGLSKGTKRVFVTFVVNTEGLITDAIIRAPDLKISEESKRVLAKFPKMKPAKLGGVVVNVKYSFPYTLIIE